MAKARRRVFFMLDSLNIGGTETQAVELAVRLDPSRYDVSLGCLRAEGPLSARLEGSPVRVLEFYPKGGLNTPRGLLQLGRLTSHLRAERPVVMHAHDLWANLLAIPAARLARVPVTIASQRDLSHLGFYQTGGRKWLRRIQRAATLVLANSGAVRESLLREGFLPEKVRVIHNGIDASRFIGDPGRRARLFPEWNGRTLVVLVGNMHTEVKGHPELIHAAGRVVAEFPEVQFLLLGDGTSREPFQALTRSLGVEGNFAFLGRRLDVPEVLSCADIAVLPSRAEGLPNAVLEYLAAGLPTIATDVGGSAEIIADGVNGLLVPPEDPGALAEALLRLLRSPAESARLAERGTGTVRTEFSFERMIERTEALYEELLARAGR